MIHYDSHEWSLYWKFRGSIFPRAMLAALPSATLAFCIKYFQLFDMEELMGGDAGSGTVYSGFTFVLGFVLVFRTSESYQRYWTAATAVHKMKAEWLDACGSLISFAQLSTQGTTSIRQFAHTMIRLFGLMHAMALEEIAGADVKDLPLLDIEGLNKDDLRLLGSTSAQGRKPEIVSQWIKVCILKNMKSGVLSVPAPILTRVFQELGTGLVMYHEALQVVIWPFPFPYAQMSAVLVAIYMVVAPLVLSMWAEDPYYCFVATEISVMCMKGIDMISIELENPFGDDPNDLPTLSMHCSMNRGLALYINEETWKTPELLSTYVKSYRELVTWDASNKNGASLLSFYVDQDTDDESYRMQKVSSSASGLTGGTIPSTPSRQSTAPKIGALHRENATDNGTPSLSLAVATMRAARRSSRTRTALLLTPRDAKRQDIHLGSMKRIQDLLNIGGVGGDSGHPPLEQQGEDPPTTGTDELPRVDECPPTPHFERTSSFTGGDSEEPACVGRASSERSAESAHFTPTKEQARVGDGRVLKTSAGSYEPLDSRDNNALHAATDRRSLPSLKEHAEKGDGTAPSWQAMVKDMADRFKEVLEQVVQHQEHLHRQHLSSLVLGAAQVFEGQELVKPASLLHSSAPPQPPPPFAPDPRVVAGISFKNFTVAAISDPCPSAKASAPRLGAIPVEQRQQGEAAEQAAACGTMVQQTGVQLQEEFLVKVPRSHPVELLYPAEASLRQV